MLKMGSINISATSRIDGTDVAYYNASFSENGTYTISKNIVNAAAYSSKQSECDADYAEFEEKAKECETAAKESLETQSENAY